MRRPSRADSRTRLLAAAAALFAARGFAGAQVDQIARRARVNKAMIYYHFDSKLGLYREILREMFRAVGERARTMAASPQPPEAKLRAFVEALVREAERRPHFPPIMLRELAEQGAHLDAQTLQLLGTVPRTLHGILAEGAATGAFRTVPSFMLYLTIVGPVILYFASAPVRARMARLGVLEVPPIDTRAFEAHVQDTALARLLQTLTGVSDIGADGRQA